MNNNNFLKETHLLDFSHPKILGLAEENCWKNLSDKDKIKAIYDYVRDDIKFGYNESDLIKASKILEDGYGQCNTKSILLMALLRASNIPCRVHGFLINKSLQRGILTGLPYLLAPNELVHTWTEVFYNNNWYALEGVILDKEYLGSAIKSDKVCSGGLCYYAAAIDNLSENKIDWNENDTYIQKDAITRDLGVFESPDVFFEKYPQKLNSFKEYIYKNFVRKKMNRNADKLRQKKN